MLPANHAIAGLALTVIAVICGRYHTLSDPEKISVGALQPPGTHQISTKSFAIQVAYSNFRSERWKRIAFGHSVIRSLSARSPSQNSGDVVEAWHHIKSDAHPRANVLRELPGACWP
jgi:hypothetical protein